MGVVIDEVEAQIEQSPTAPQQSNGESDSAQQPEKNCDDCVKHYERRMKRLYAD